MRHENRAESNSERFLHADRPDTGSYLHDGSHFAVFPASPCPGRSDRIGQTLRGFRFFRVRTGASMRKIDGWEWPAPSRIRFECWWTVALVTIAIDGPGWGQTGASVTLTSGAGGSQPRAEWGRTVL